MRRALHAFVIAAASLAGAFAALAAPAYSTTKEAEKHVPNWNLVGEYGARDGQSALQATVLKNGDFLVARYAGGLPGDGWDGSKIDSFTSDAENLKTLLEDFERVERSGPTLGKPAPKNALIAFPKGLTNIENGLMRAGGKTTVPLGSFKLHVEFMLPIKPTRDPSNQDRANSGIYIFNNYELQVLDSFGLDLHAPNNAIKVESDANRWCGALYKTKTPDINMAFPPLRWQTYDIKFRAPVFDGDVKTKNARITVRHNGVLIHDDVELKTGTGNGAKQPQLAEGLIFFQSHGAPVVYRNVWATEL